MPSSPKWMSLSGSQRAAAASSWTVSDCIFQDWWSYRSTDQTDLDLIWLVCGCEVFNLCLSPLRWGGLRGEKGLYFLFVSFGEFLSPFGSGGLQAASSVMINYIAVLLLSPDNRWGGIATFRIFSFFVPLLNTVIESPSPSWFRNVRLDTRGGNMVCCLQFTVASNIWSEMKTLQTQVNDPHMHVQKSPALGLKLWKTHFTSSHIICLLADYYIIISALYLGPKMSVWKPLFFLLLWFVAHQEN